MTIRPFSSFIVPFCFGTTVLCAELRDLPLAPPTVAPDATRGFSRLDAGESGITVPNLYNDPRMWGDRFREYTLGALETGLAAADFDGDDRIDIYAVSKNGPNALYRQIAPGKFEDIAASAGVDVADDPAGQTGATAVDINQDGWIDIYLCRHDATNLLFINQGDGTFTEAGAAYGLDMHDASVHAAFADYDGDGDLDAYVATNMMDFSRSPGGQPDYLMRNNGDGTFTNVATAAGIWGKSQGHTAIWFDANRDGWPDIYVANDFETPDRFYLNQGDGTFIDVVDERLPHVTYFSMGADAGDLNNDGEIDFLVADMRDQTRAGYMTGMEEMGRGLWEMERVEELIPQYMWNAVYLGTGTDRFEEVAHLTGMNATGWTWAARIADLDNDGLADVFYTNGMLRNFVDADLVDKQNVAPNLAARARVWKNAPVRAESNLAFRNHGQLEFSNVSKDWGLDQVGVSFGCVVTDLDNDGDLDLVWANQDGPPTVMRNDIAHGHRIAVQLMGRPPNRHAIGAELTVVTPTGTQIKQVYGERGVVSSERGPVIFGLGDNDDISSLHVRWPDGSESLYEHPPVDRRLIITQTTQPAERTVAEVHATPAATLYTEVAEARGLHFTSDAYPLDELATQRLLPRRLGHTAPGLATADVNHDGNADLFVTGSRGQAGRLFLADAAGNFHAAPDQPWETASAADDIRAAFLDANADGHPDLFIAAGGVERDNGDPIYQDRLYLGDGQGGFTTAPADTLPEFPHPSTVISAADYDADGRIDLFVGGGTVPHRWPQASPNQLLRNTPNGFERITAIPDTMHAGRTTGAQWADIDDDGDADLVTATEWGGVHIFRNDDGQFEDISAVSGLGEITGWWRTLQVADMNNDQRLDIIVGNVGTNTKYRASFERPTVVFAGDLDGRSDFEILEAQYDEDGRLYPLRGRSKLSYSFPALRRKFRTFERFSQASVEEIFDPELLAQAMRLEANTLISGIFYQNASGQFHFDPLPREAQIGPINDTVRLDVDGDQRYDLFVAGNDFGPEPSTGRFDGSLGRLLINRASTGDYEPIPPARSGLFLPGETRDMILLPPLRKGERPRIVTASAQGPVRLFEPTLKSTPK